MKVQKTNKGITLIALVITIIVMLILVGVTITMAVNGGLFEYASSAGTQTNVAISAEQEFANIEAGMTVEQMINKYTEGTEGNNIISFSIDGNTLSAPKGSTLSYVIVSNKSYEVTDKGYILSDMGSLVLCTSDGKRVKVSSEILNGHDYKWTEYIPCNCIDGYIYGYKCDRDDCDEISTGWDKEVTLYEASCSSCGTRRTSSFDGEWYCSKCYTSQMFTPKEWKYIMGGCMHEVNNEPVQQRFPCPYCANE